MDRVLAYVSGGSNLDAAIHLPQAARELKSRYPGARFSRCYRNGSVGFDGPDFINFVVELPVVGKAFALREYLQRIEKLCGRPDAAPRWAPRAMDLDILMFGDQVIDEQGMKVPRPDLTRWAFMLGPLAELAPALVHPLRNVSICELWQQFDRDAHPLQPVALDLNTVECPPMRVGLPST